MWGILAFFVFVAMLWIAQRMSDPEGMNNPPGLPPVNDPGPTELDLWKS